MAFLAYCIFRWWVLFCVLSTVNIVLRDAGPKCPVDNERLSEAQVSECFVQIIVENNIIVAEILAVTIRSREDIQGIMIGQEEFKLVQYADDLTLFVPNTHP